MLVCTLEIVYSKRRTRLCLGAQPSHPITSGRGGTPRWCLSLAHVGKDRVPSAFSPSRFYGRGCFGFRLHSPAWGYISIDDDLRRALLLPALLLGAFGPAVGACFSIATLHGKSTLKTFLKSFLSIRFGWKVWLSIFAVLGGINVVAWYIPELFGHVRLEMLLPSVFVFPVVWLFMVVLGGGQEEIGWRGYAMPLLESRYGLWTGNLVLGLVWSLWHVPL
jgi:hypothetical protein